MKNNNKLNAILVVLVGIMIGLGCSGSGSTSDQKAEANKIIDEANKKLEEGRTLYTMTELRNNTLFSAPVKTVGQLQAYKNAKASEAKSIAEDFEKAGQMLKEVGKQYDDVSRMNIDEKYKEYVKLKSDEYNKRAEAIDVKKGNAQAFMEIDDYRTMVSRFEENNKKSEKLFKDAEEIEAKAKKMEEEHKELFR